MVIVVVIVSSSVVFCAVVDSFCFGAVWILSTRRLSVVRVVFHCCGFFPLQSRVDSFHSAAHRRRYRRHHCRRCHRHCLLRCHLSVTPRRRHRCHRHRRHRHRRRSRRRRLHQMTMALLPFGFIKRIAVCFSCGDSGVLHAGASQRGRRHLASGGSLQRYGSSA